MRARFIKTDGTDEVRELTERLSLSELQAAVGGYIEAVDLTYPEQDGTWTTMWVNEEGKVNDLPFNQKATEIARPGVHIFGDDVIVGDVVLTDYDDD